MDPMSSQGAEFSGCNRQAQLGEPMRSDCEETRYGLWSFIRSTLLAGRDRAVVRLALFVVVPGFGCPATDGPAPGGMSGEQRKAHAGICAAVSTSPAELGFDPELRPGSWPKGAGRPIRRMLSNTIELLQLRTSRRVRSRS